MIRPVPAPLLALLLAARMLPAAPAAPADPFTYRGYYFILSRNPGYGLDDYKLILDRMADDRANLLILWIGGGFPSKKFPETWDYNREHRNCKESFLAAAIDHAHLRGIRVLLGLTPFAYDGVNRHGAAHPELGALDAEGKPAVTGGIHSLGRGLCPSKAGSRDFMLDYCREMFDDFYPGADGFFLEHSDYGTCRCAECGTGAKGLRREWEFVLDLSAHVWKKKPGALVMIYPQYTSLGVEFDPRFLVFLAPHNMAGAEKVRNPKVLWTGYWDCGAFFRDLCRTAAQAGYAGVIPSMENFNYENPHAFDTRWGPPGVVGWDDLLVRVTRLSFREFAARPDLDEDGFRSAVRSAFFDPDSPDSAVRDLLALHRHLNRWDGWTWRGGVVKAPAVPLGAGNNDADLKDRTALEREIVPVLEELKEIRERSAAIAGESPATPGKRTLAEMAGIAGWVLERWEGKAPR